MAVSPRLRFTILQRDQYRCRYCGRRAPDVVLHVDHIVPRSFGGSDDPANLAAACADCNLGKGAADGRDDEQLVASIVDLYAPIADAVACDVAALRPHYDHQPDYWGVPFRRFLREAGVVEDLAPTPGISEVRV